MDTLAALLGEKLAEIEVDGSFAAATDTVAAVKDSVRSLLQSEARKRHNVRGSSELALGPADRLTLYLSGRPLQDETAFYDDNYILLPVWIQVLVHRCSSEEAVRRINALQR